MTYFMESDGSAALQGVAYSWSCNLDEALGMCVCNVMEVLFIALMIHLAVIEKMMYEERMLRVLIPQTIHQLLVGLQRKTLDNKPTAP